MKILSNQFTEAIGWTLAHSLWQASLVALLLAIALVLFNQKSAKFRYSLGVGAMATIFLMSMGTFFYEYSDETAELYYTATSSESEFYEEEPLSVYEKAVTDTPFSLMAFSSYFEEHLPLIVTCWLFGVLVFSLRLIGSFALLQRVRNYRNYPVNTQWQLRLKELSIVMKINQKVKFLESAIINSPIVVGYFKPIILVPVGMLSSLPTEQIEAILAHELAHIRRNDYMINVIQNVIETLFFFHPAVWWISSLVRHERECCCDDIAVQATKSSVNLAKALTELETFKQHRSQADLALAMKGRSGKLYQRISRIVSNKPNIPAFKEGLFLVSVVIACLFFSTLQANNTPVKSNEIVLSEELTPILANDILLVKDTTKKVPVIFKEGAKNFAYTEEGIVYHIVMNDENEVIDLYVNGKQIAKTNYKEYESAIEKAKNVTMPTPPGAPRPVEEIEEVIEAVPAPVVYSPSLNIKNGKITYSTTNEDGEYVFAKLDEDYKIMELFIDGEKANEKQEEKYNEILKKEMEDLEVREEEFREQERELREVERALFEERKMRELTERELQMHELKLRETQLRAEQEYMVAQEFAKKAEMSAQMEAMRARKAEQSALLNRMTFDIGKLKQKLEEAKEEQKDELRKELEKELSVLEKLEKEQKRAELQSMKALEKMEQLKQLEQNHKKEIQKHREEIEKQFEEFEVLKEDINRKKDMNRAIQELLLQDNLIQSSKKYRFEIDRNSMTVDGKKFKLDKIHKKYLKLMDKYELKYIMQKHFKRGNKYVIQK